VHLSKLLAFSLLASIIVSFLAGSAAPTPLYAVYQTAWGFTPITITLVFGIYALAVLGALLVLGGVSDFVGRRPVLIVAVLLQAAAMLVFATATGVSSLILARIIQGISAGAAVGAVGAGMLDIDRQKGTIANAVGPMTGTATGGIVSGLLVRYFPSPLHLVYFVFFGIFLAQAIGIVFMAESVSRKPGALAVLRPQFRLPPAVRLPMMLAAPTLVAAWSLAGFYGSLVPTLVRQLAGGGSVLLGGLALFVLAGSGALTVLCLGARDARALMRIGTMALVAGVALTLVAITANSLAGFFVGTAIAGMGFGAGFQGAIRSVVPLAHAHERAGVLSVLYVVAYLAMGVPAVLGGIMVVHGGGLFTTAREYGFAVMLLAAVALLGTFTRRETAQTVVSEVAQARCR
jgi:predicted MFS family arabinose efflux permease